MNHLDSLYRRQQPRRHPLRDDHDYTQYLNQQKVYRDEAAQKQKEFMAQQMGMTVADYEAYMAYDGHQMPSANQIIASRSLGNNYAPEQLITPPD